MGKKFLPVLTSLLICASCYTKGQPSAPALASAISVDLEKHTVDEIPFDKAFYFAGDIKADWKIRSIVIEMAKDRIVPAHFDTISTVTVGTRVHFIGITLPGAVEKDYLLPDREYTLRFTSFDSANNPLASYSFTYGLLVRSKIGDHTKLDFGIAYAPTPKALVGFTSVNIYFTPINDETNLKRITSVRRNIFLRTSVFMGISPITLSSDTKQPMKNRFGAGNFVFGIAIRSPFYGCYTPGIGRVGQKLLQPMRLSFGEMLYKQVNANPLIAAEVNKGAFYMGLSYDINIAAILGPIGKLISP